MHHESFLQQVAKCIASKHDTLKNILVVFPNHRSNVYFFNLLKQLYNKKVWLPQALTINEFIQLYSTNKIADQLKLLVMLYNAYAEVAKVNESFDDFYHWGQMMLADFDNVDKYLVSAKAVFTNTKDYKNLSNAVDFLTEEQIEVIKRFFIEFEPDKTTELKQTFLKTWEHLFDIYTVFNKNLDVAGVGYEGQVYRKAQQNIADLKACEFSFDKVYFVGFNAITRCEESIFESLKVKNKAGFFWDYDAMYVQDKNMDAGLFLRDYIKKFPPEILFEGKSLLKGKDIELVSVPTDAGQVFQVSQLLQKQDAADYQNTAVVLADEHLLNTIVSYLPKVVSDVNITMGYPMKDSNLGSFMNLFIELQKSRRGDANKGFMYYYKYVFAMLRHPFCSAFNNTANLKLIDDLTAENLFYIPANILQINVLLELVFSGMNTASSISKTLLKVFRLLQVEFANNDAFFSQFKVDLEFIYQAQGLVAQLDEELNLLAVELQLPTFFNLLNKVLQSVKVTFEGEPVKGLQLMGFLETRNLDFDNVIILSVNEGVLPASGDMPSFIPYSLRRTFGMPVQEHQDAMYAYYFYRIMQRAKKVTLLYNSGSLGMSSGEKSRLAYQLIYNPAFNIHQNPISQTIEIASKKELIVKKEGRVAELLNAFLTDENKKLSPSALSKYLLCPLQFYYSSVLYLRSKDTMEDGVDARLFGNIFHKAAEKIYKPFQYSKQLVSVDDLTILKNNKAFIDNSILEAFKDTIYGEKSVRNFKLEGKNHLVFDVIKKYINRLIDLDKAHTPFSILGLETSLYKEINFSVNQSSCNVLVGGQIDRLDRTEKGVRVIDYKTGKDLLKFSDLDSVFDTNTISKTKAVFQTFLYALVFAHNNPNEPQINPAVYQVKEFFTKGKKFNVESTSDSFFTDGNFKTIEAEVDNRMKSLLSELFNINIPFIQTDDERRCEYCDYKTMCGR